MQTEHCVGPTKKELKNFLIALLFVVCGASNVYAQDATYPPPKPTPPKIEQQVIPLPESVVQMQWPHTLDLVNAPQSVALLNPGQCIRIGVYATGGQHDVFLKIQNCLIR